MPAAAAAVQRQIEGIRKGIERGKLASTMSVDTQYACHGTIAMLEDMLILLGQKMPADGTVAFKLLKGEFDKHTKALKKQAADAGKQLSNAFVFCQEVFGEGQEMLILVTELTISQYGARFISRYGCKEYFSHNKELLFYERQKEIITQLETLELEE